MRNVENIIQLEGVGLDIATLRDQTEDGSAAASLDAIHAKLTDICRGMIDNLSIDDAVRLERRRQEIILNPTEDQQTRDRGPFRL